MRFSYLVLLVLLGCTVRDVEILVPEDYEGTVVIIYDEDETLNSKYITSQRNVYRVPSNGVVKSKAKPDNGFKTLSLFSYNATGIISELPIIYSYTDIDPESSQIVGYNPRVGAKVERFSEEGDLIRTYPTYLDLIIGRMSQIDSLSKRRDDFIFEQVYDK